MSDEFSLDHLVIKPTAAQRPELMMLYGPYGGGKTWLAASASEVEDLAPVLYIDCEGSTTGTVSEFDEDKIDIWLPKRTHKGQEFMAVKTMINNLISKDHKYKTVVIDPLNTFFEWAKKKGDKPNDGFAKWNFVHDEITAEGALISKLKDADFLAILVVHEAKEGGEDDGPTFADFRWQGQGKALLGQYPDMVGYVTRDTNSAGVSTTTLQTAPTKRSNAKNRFGLPAKITDPSMKRIYEMIESKEDK